MKRFLHLIIMVVLCLFISCSDTKKEITETKTKKKEVVKKKPLNPFTELDLKDLSAFKPTGKNWEIVGDVVVDRAKKKTISFDKGTGILLNKNDQKKGANKNLISAFEHKDIELELDVMVPVKSNSGIYFQSRYEVQVFDSWNVKELRPKDMGAIYERWDKNAPKGQQGYEGHPPRINAAKAPGLWQHIKVIFHAPKFDKQGNKVKNAWFEEVWLNGVLVHQNIELTGPTRGPFNDEKATAPLFIQGDHGPVAYKNIKYRLFNGEKITVSDLTKKEYKSQENFEKLENQTPIKVEKTDKFTLIPDANQKQKKIITYTGTLNVPKTGKYIFEIRPGRGSVNLKLDGQKDWSLKSTNAYKKKAFNLKKGTVKFELKYNHTHPRVKWKGYFSWFIESLGIQKFPLQHGEDVNGEKFDPLKGIIIEPEAHNRTQRSFVKHKGVSRTHCISVGTTDGTHYSYDLATGSLLKVWNGEFLNTTHMWLSRGLLQLGEPIGFSIEMHGDLEFASIENENTVWPKPLPENKGIKQLGYEFDDHQIPTFSYEMKGATISNKFLTNKKQREVQKVIQIDSQKSLWHKIADGEDIKELPNHTYVINPESYYIDFTGNESLTPIIRTNNGKKELLVKVPAGSTKLSYKIIW